MNDIKNLLSEEEIDKLINELDFEESQTQFDFDDIRDHNETLCDHQFINYTGLNEQYQFCTVCGEKR